MLDQDNEMPLFRQIKEIIKNSILNDEFKPGNRIPSEVDFINKYSVSRVTLRKAINGLVEEGYLVKKQGKGTYVRRPKIERKLEHLASFTAACEANGLTAGSKVIKIEILEEGREEKERLALKPDDKIIYIQRIRFAGKEPLMIENNYFSFEKFGFLLDEKLEGSLFDMLRKKHGIIPRENVEGASSTSIEMVRASVEHAKMLEVNAGSPLFYIDTVIFDQFLSPIHIGKQYIKGDRYKFVIR